MKIPQIAIVHLDTVGEETFEEFLEIVRVKGLTVESNSRPDGGMFASLELLIASTVFVVISKTYFDGFLKEMGKDHYVLLKKGLNALWSKVLGPSAPKITLYGSKGKLAKQQPYSLYFSVLAEAQDRVTFKLLFENDCSPEVYAEALNVYFDFLERYHEGKLTESEFNELQAAKIVGSTLLLAYSYETKILRAIDPVPASVRAKSEVK
jgi:hypothetical protein